ncbi:hypothetical protein ACOMHN_037865 [Nucella lapillus]
MDTLGPVSVLDSGRRHRDVLVADRLTRRRSPDRPGRLKTSHSEMDVVYRIPQPYRTSFSAKHSVERLPGSDRSRSLSPTSSLRSFHSCRSERVGVRRHGHGRAKSPKRVTYDTRVTVRHSDADDSMFTELSSREFESSPSSYSYSSSRSPASLSHTSTPSNRHMSKDSGLDYSTQLRDLSDQIIKMDWSHKEQAGAAAAAHSPQGILKESQNSHKHPPLLASHGPSSPGRIPTTTTTPVSSRTIPQVGVSDKENAPNGSPSPPPPPPRGGGQSGQPRVVGGGSISRDYQHERTFTYQEAAGDSYSPEVRVLVDASLQETSTTTTSSPLADGRENGGGLLAQQRSSSVSAVSKASTTQTSNQLTPAKRSVSTSIGNFFKRISPHLGRRKGKDRSNNGSRAGSSQSLPATGVATMDPDAPSSPPTLQPSSTSAASSSSGSSSGHFSRSRIRNSFLKLMGGGQRKDSKSKVAAAISSTPAPSSQGGDLNTSTGSQESEASSDKNNASDGERNPLPDATQRKLKSMEKNNLGKKDVYREFKEKRSSPRSTTSSTSSADAKLEERYRAIKAQYKDRPHPLDDEFSFEAYDAAGSTPSPLKPPQSRPSPDWLPESLKDGGSEDEDGRRGMGGKASTISTISGDESIGECSLDCNLTASQPSLLSGTSQSAGSNLSKKAVFNQSLLSSTDGSLPSDDPSAPLRRQKDALVLGQELIETSTPVLGGYKENASLPLSPLSPSSTADPNRKPSYLKLSCAVSGYGKYSRYSSYKSIPTRSPFSSTSSLRSDLSSPDPTMPSSVRSPNDILGKRDQGGRSLGSSPISAAAAVMAAAGLSNGQLRLFPPAFNGHAAAAQGPGLYPTGDPVKDGDYFLSIMASEEERLNQQSKRAEGLMRSQDLPEEVNGRIRAAIGKSNLLISRKFQQFKELCSQHMHPEPEERIPLYEDLQGFWDMIKIQVDNVDDNFAEIDHMSQNGWKEVPRLVPSRRSSASSSPKSGSLSQTSTPSATPGHTPGSRRRGLKANNKDTPDSSPEHAEKMRSAAKARDEARKRMLAEKRAAMKQQQQQQQQQQGTPDVEIFLPEGNKM